MLRHLGYNGPDLIALFPPLLLNTISTDFLLSCHPEGGNDLLAEYIQRNIVDNYCKGGKMAGNLATIVTSKAKRVTISRDQPCIIIGERINPTGRKVLQAALKEENFDIVRRDAIAQVEAGADILDINVGVPGGDEAILLIKAIKAVREVTDVPLCIDTADPEAMEAALKVYDGKPMVNSVTGEDERLKEVLPLVKEYNAAVIGLCMDEEGIPPTAEGRFKVAAKIIERAGRLGILAEDVVIDPLVLTVGANYLAGRIALDATKMIVKEFGVNITMGVSNISYGMPDRRALNAALIAMAIHAGLTCPIVNPLHEEIVKAILAADLLMGHDEYSARWIKAYRQRREAADRMTFRFRS
ncbi:MAG: dihydropteroate synthase [Chloroflexota bacterium]|nr:dihydropteroate synthase [Chloroflexota bacterium]